MTGGLVTDDQNTAFLPTVAPLVTMVLSAVTMIVCDSCFVSVFELHFSAFSFITVFFFNFEAFLPHTASPRC
jgi:hypothetical protein